MLHYLVAALLLLHTAFWGAGLSWLVLPRRWRPAWWVFAPGFGYALQSAVVWVGASAGLAGTDRYALASELLPVALACWALRRGARPWRIRLGSPAAGVAVLLVAGGMLLWPMTRRGQWTLTSSSLGSCDHADYAAGARVFQEFARPDRVGFLGLQEVSGVGSAETFFEFWLKLNHFTPSALIAHQASLLHLRPHELVSLNGVVVLLSTVPLLLLLARAVGLRRPARLAVAGLHAVSPLGAYAVHHGALGQLYAAHGIALLTLAVMAGAESSRERWRYIVVALAAVWLLAGAYNFILTVALAPAMAWVVGRALAGGGWRGVGRALGIAGAAYAGAGLLFWGRFTGMVERFRLFAEYDFGWPVPALWPTAWLGWVGDVHLHGGPSWLQRTGTLAVALAWAAGCWSLRRRPAAALRALAFVLPVVAGWGMLAWESGQRANASYDAFKILSVFLPVLIAGLCVWAAAPGPRHPRAAAAGLALLLAGSVWSSARYLPVMAHPPLRVERALADLRKLEALPQVTSLNMRIDDFWMRLWANYFLLRKPQYFLTHTYEGRRNTPLRGEWDLREGMLHCFPADSNDWAEVNAQFYAVRIGAGGRVGAEFGPGWFPLEGSGAHRWHWSAGAGTLVLSNPAPAVRRLRIEADVRSVAADTLILMLDGREVGRQPAAAVRGTVSFPAFEIPAGTSRLEFVNAGGARTASATDRRRIGVALYSCRLIAVR
ncbi:MAG: hypothetical protein C0502_07515 [Opitutus sp.]|nr:hypothetical protein [Opitutus sp.]